jgi:hypothetical protein
MLDSARIFQDPSVIFRDSTLVPAGGEIDCPDLPFYSDFLGMLGRGRETLERTQQIKFCL